VPAVPPGLGRRDGAPQGSADGIVGDTVSLIHEGEQFGTARILAAEIREDGRVLAVRLDVDERTARFFNLRRFVEQRSGIVDYA
jgi:hypothetical protein